MTLAITQQNLSLELVPMRLPEADPFFMPIASDSDSPEGNYLLIVPGERSEMLVKLENLGSETVELDFDLAADFPLEWCSIRSESPELEPGESQTCVLYFEVPKDFFETNSAISLGQTLKIDYSGRLDVYGTYPASFPQLLQLAKFTLFIRPHSEYLNYIPQIYREIDFIGRFLKIFEQTFEPSFQTLSSLWAYLDPLTAPQAMLPFLSHWVGWEIQPYLSLEQQRYLIRNAMEIYRWRGTRRGLRLYLHLATGLPIDEHTLEEKDKHISIYESFSNGLVFGETSLGETAILGGGRPFHFYIRLRCPSAQQIDRQLVIAVIEQEKPAFCTFDLYIENSNEQ